MNRRRRAYLGSCGSAVLAMLAGCPGRGGPANPTTDEGTTTPSGAPPTSAPPTATATATATDSASPTATRTPTNEVVRWRVETPRPVLAPPVVRDGTLYAVEGSTDIRRPTGEPTDHALFALSVADGRERWRVPLGAPAYDAPLVAGERVFATAGFSTGFSGVDFRVIAVERERGDPAWTFENRDSDQFVRPIAATAGVLLVGRFDDAIGPTEAFVSGLDVGWGGERWRYETGDVLSGTADADSFYVGSPAGVYGLTAADGTDRWRYADAAAEPAPVATNGLVYLTGDAVLAAVDPRSGRPRFRVETGEGFVTDRVVTDEFAVIGTFDGWLRSVTASTGEANWERRLGTTLWSVDRRADGAVIAVVDVSDGAPTPPGTATDRLVYAVDERTGDVDELLGLRGGEQLAVADRTVYVWDDATGVVSAVDVAGKRRWRVDLGVGIRTAAVTRVAICLSTTDGALVALGA